MYVHHRDHVSLNDISHDAAMFLVQAALDDGVNITEVYKHTRVLYVYKSIEYA